MIEQSCRKVTVIAMALITAVGVATAQAETSAPAYTTEGFMDAALKNCLEVQMREPRQCQCEQKLITGDRLSEDDKQMAYFFWVNKDEYKKRFEAKIAADPKWQQAFSQRFANLQALVVSACGR